MKINFYPIDEKMANKDWLYNCLDLKDNYDPNEEYKRSILYSYYSLIEPNFKKLDSVNQEKVELLFNLYCQKRADYINKLHEIRTICPSVLNTELRDLYSDERNNLKLEKMLKLAKQYSFLGFILDKIYVICSKGETVNIEDECALRKFTLKLSEELMYK